MSRSACTTGLHSANVQVRSSAHGESDFRLAAAAYDHAKTATTANTCSSSPRWIPTSTRRRWHRSQRKASCTCRSHAGCSLEVPTEPYHPTYFMINGRSMPDDMDPNYAAEYPHQPYNGNPHMHPGELVLLRIIGQGRWQHPFHEHANHVRILARDGNLILSQTESPKTSPAPALFTTTTTPGQTMDGIFYFTGRGLNWDMYGHNSGSSDPRTRMAKLPCVADANGYNTAATPPAPVRHQLLRVVPGSQQAAGGGSVRRCRRRRPRDTAQPEHLYQRRMVRRQPLSGTGCDRATRPGSGARLPELADSSDGAPNCTSCSLRNTQANPSNERGFAFMWHSHNEREITTNNVFPGRNDDDDACRFPGIRDRRIELARENRDAELILKTIYEKRGACCYCSPARSGIRNSPGQQINLTAGPTSASLPDGKSVPMWGYTCGSVHPAPPQPAPRLNPNAGGGWSPVVITVPTGSRPADQPDEQPFVCPWQQRSDIDDDRRPAGRRLGSVGQRTTTPSPEHSTQTDVTWSTAAAAAQSFTPPTQGPRVQSFGTEVAAGANAVSLTWNNLRPGTYLLESGTHPSIQVPMGLYGMLVVTNAAGNNGRKPRIQPGHGLSWGQLRCGCSAGVG